MSPLQVKIPLKRAPAFSMKKTKFDKEIELNFFKIAQGNILTRLILLMPSGCPFMRTQAPAQRY